MYKLDIAKDGKWTKWYNNIEEYYNDLWIRDNRRWITIVNEEALKFGEHFDGNAFHFETEEDAINFIIKWSYV